MGDIEIRGAEKLSAVAKELKKVGAKDLQKELYSALNRATKTMRAEANKAAEQNLPKTGGLNKRVAAARLSTRRRAGKNPGVRIVAKGLQQLELIDRGVVRHPVYGHRDRYVAQKIPDAEGWFTKSMEDGAPEARKEILEALDSVAKKLAHRY